MIDGLQTLPLLVFPALVIVAALFDVTSMTIPNWISAALALIFFPAALLAGAPLAEIGVAAAVGVAALALGIAMFALRWIGGGDAKLLAASALWLGPTAVGPFAVWTALAGGVLALGLLSARKAAAFAPGLSSSQPAWLGRLLAPAGDIPYGIAIAAGALLTFPQSALMIAVRSAA